MPRTKQIITDAEIGAFTEGLKRLVQQTQEQARKISTLEAEVAHLRSSRAGRGASNGVHPRPASNGARPAAWGTLLTSALAKRVLSAVQGAKGGLSTIDLAKKLNVPKAQVKRITHGFKRKGTFKVKGIKRQAKYHFAR